VSSGVSEILEGMRTKADGKKALSTVRSTLGFLAKTLKTIIDNPSQLRHRKVMMKNFAVKKFFTNVEGAADILLRMGFQFTTDKKHGDFYFLSESQNDLSSVESGLELIDAYVALIDEELDESGTATASAGGARKLCKANCGFFGSPDTDEYCSLCFKKKFEAKRPEVKEDAVAAEANAIPVRSAAIRWKMACIKVLATVRFAEVVNYRNALPKQEDTTRCWHCNKKLGILGVECKCGYYYCAKHRSTLDHECSYNFRSAYKKKLAKSNPTVVAKKMERIDDSDAQ